MSEAEWLRNLRNFPKWIPPHTPALIVAPHPDDETLGAGGLIAYLRSHGLEVVVVAVTDGENAYADQTGLGDVRRVEQADALARLGVETSNIIRLGLPDSKVASHEDELVDRLTELVSRGTHVVSTWKGDRHPDHEACGRAAEIVSLRVGARLTSYFFWTWHWSDPSSLRNLDLRCFPLSEAQQLAKSEALLCHRSQLFRCGGEPILPESLLAPARRPFEVFAVA